MNFLGSLRIPDHFDHAYLVLRCNDLIGLHPKIETCVEPDLVHDFDQLESEHILSNIISILKYNLDSML